MQNGWDPPNQAYRLAGSQNLPITMRNDAGELDNEICPIDGSVLQRVGSNDFFNCRCRQCGQMYGVAHI